MPIDVDVNVDVVLSLTHSVIFSEEEEKTCLLN